MKSPLNQSGNVNKNGLDIIIINKIARDKMVWINLLRKYYYYFHDYRITKQVAANHKHANHNQGINNKMNKDARESNYTQ